MSKTFNLKTDDDARKITLKLTSSVVPDTAILIISGNGTRLERTLVYDAIADRWSYQFTDDDFETLEGKNYKAEAYATFGDGTNGTYPTVGTLSIRAQKRL